MLVAPIPRKYVAVYALLFGLSVAVATAGAMGDGGSWVGMVIQTARNLEPLAVVAAPVTYAIVELLTMLAEIFLRMREEKGWVRGRAEGHVEGRVEGLAEGRVEGHAEGRVEGHAEGRVEGLAEGRNEVLDLIESEVGLTPEQRKAIEDALKSKDE